MRDLFITEGIPFYAGKKVVVTGAAGLIGSYAVKLLKESGAIVRAICHLRKPNEFTSMADEVCAYESSSDRDLNNPQDANETVKGQEIVIGCAGITGGVNLPSIDPVSYVGPATAMVINTLQACVENKVSRFGFLSSTTVYAPSDKPVKESDVELPAPLYRLYRGIGESKRWLEKLCRYYQEETGLQIGIIRPSGAYGRFDNFDLKTSHVVPGMIERALHTTQEQNFEVWGDGKDVRDFIHAQDVARCLLLTVAYLPSSTPINCASGIAITTAELAQNVLQAAGKNNRITFRADKPSALKVRLVDTAIARDSLGFVQRISLAAGLWDTVAWRKGQIG